MEQRRLGNSSLVSSVVGFGTWEMGGTQYGPIDPQEAVAAVHYALDNGVTLFDTALGYGPHRSEELLGQALGPRRKDIILVTKVGLVWREGSLLALEAGRDHILTETDGCLSRLGTDYVDLLIIHWPDHHTPAAETIGTLEDLKKAGKIREYAVSNYTVEMMEECEKYGHLAANQVGYNLFDRRMEKEVLPYCVQREIGFMAYGSLGFGLLTGEFKPDTRLEPWDWRSRGNAFELPLFQPESYQKELKVVDRLKDLARRYDKTVAQLALAWVLSNPAVSVALTGIRRPSEIAENVAEADWRLGDDIKAEIDQIFTEENVPTYRDAPQAVYPPALKR
ncbi:MAG: aldo/keto reductase [Dehalococcoidales bacterium]|nr:aldo/keto reductase [Dehalococcoidales bacterium]